MVRYGLFDRSSDLNSFKGVPWFLVPHRTKCHKEKPGEAPIEDPQKIQLIVWSRLGLSNGALDVTCEACREDTARLRVVIEQIDNLLFVMVCVGAAEMAP